ncbi:hypothetical protein GCM10028825_43040 [Spirosoma agri]
MAALLAVAYNRHQRLEDATQDLRRNVTQQESQIKNLQQRLQDCDTVAASVPIDTASGWGPVSVNDSTSTFANP